MRKLILIAFLVGISITFANAAALPGWFIKSFNNQKLNQHYLIVNNAKPTFLEADFNGDSKNDVAVQLTDIKTKKKGILIINFGQNKFYVFGAGVKFANEGFDNTNWINGWKINRDKTVYETMFKPNGDIIGGRKITIKYPAISAYMLEDEVETPVILIYWNGLKYESIHQGD